MIVFEYHTKFLLYCIVSGWQMYCWSVFFPVWGRCLYCQSITYSCLRLLFVLSKYRLSCVRMLFVLSKYCLDALEGYINRRCVSNMLFQAPNSGGVSCKATNTLRESPGMYCQSTNTGWGSHIDCFLYCQSTFLGCLQICLLKHQILGESPVKVPTLWGSLQVCTVKVPTRLRESRQSLSPGVSKYAC